MFYGFAPLLVRSPQIMETAILKAYELITNVWNVQMDGAGSIKDASDFLKYMKRHKYMGYINNGNGDITFSKVQMIQKNSKNANLKTDNVFLYF